jgi:carbon storage regulator CsrA
MLVLSRRTDEKILLPTVPAVLKLISCQAGLARIGIEAPAHVPIVREELYAPEAAPPADDPGGAIDDRLNNLALAVAFLRKLAAARDPLVRRALDGIDAELLALSRELANESALVV